MVSNGENLVIFGGIHNITWELDDLYVFDIKNNNWTMIDSDSRKKDYSNHTSLS